MISTAGPLPDGPFADMVEHGRRVASGEEDDPSFWSRWYGVQTVDHRDPDVWLRCNPSWEIMNHEDFDASCKRTTEANFRMYRLRS